jgi:branched-subunit amino acid aminotransferase/4-amino-4-deoxychorismate lyase
MERMTIGAGFLGIHLPYSTESLKKNVTLLIEQNNFSNGILRISVSRGTGQRGYSPKGADKPTLAMSLHEIPSMLAPEKNSPWRLKTASFRLDSSNPLNAYKSSNKLLQVLARAEADEAGFDDALLLNSKGMVAETSSGNIFWIREGIVHTPPVNAGILPGITRSVILQLCNKMSIPLVETHATLEEVQKSGGVFVSQSSQGVRKISHIDGTTLSESTYSNKLAQSYRMCVQTECG